MPIGFPPCGSCCFSFWNACAPSLWKSYTPLNLPKALHNRHNSPCSRLPCPVCKFGVNRISQLPALFWLYIRVLRHSGSEVCLLVDDRVIVEGSYPAHCCALSIWLRIAIRRAFLSWTLDGGVQRTSTCQKCVDLMILPGQEEQSRCPWSPGVSILSPVWLTGSDPGRIINFPTSISSSVKMG